MAENIELKSFGNFYAARIDTRKPFYLGNILLLDEMKRLMGGVIKNEPHSLPLSCPFKSILEEKAVWLSNGTFFFPNSNVRENKPLPLKPKYSNLLAPVTNFSDASDTIPFLQGKEKDGRWMFLLKYFKNGVDYRFIQKEPKWRVKDFVSKWDICIGGGASLLDSGNEIERLRYWNSQEGGKFTETDQSYSCGSMIADNGNGILYLIMNIAIPRDYKCSHPESFSWKHASHWIKNDFLNQFNWQTDGEIKNALVFDGSSARQLYFQDKKIPIYQKEEDGSIIESVRAVPHFIGLWKSKEI